ncbi:rRNA pseudouridine synthase [Microvenator marinus]|uniref:Pseudouridine synthase n=1 Tax=Microvenator marinus TaxID=2600177 RepID=A0A5B8XVG1_9DELT|nr:pseudouridine synthase [Microvenator marinus]QED28918.1 rRNA pseudouridine synthase [Microvenator marinus]
MERLDKILARRGAASRQAAQRLCRQGRVRVGGMVVRDPSQKVDGSLEVLVDGEAYEEAPLFAIYHKPVGVQSSMADNWGREDLQEVLPEAWQSVMHPVGRLDADTSGLLLFSSDGKLTQKLLHPKHEVPRVYEALVENPVDEARLRTTLAAGVETAEGVFSAGLLSVDGQTLRLEVSEGKYRMVRRILANSGHPVVKLHRVSYGGFELGNLEPGALRACEESEWEWLL